MRLSIKLLLNTYTSFCLSHIETNQCCVVFFECSIRVNKIRNSSIYYDSTFNRGFLTTITTNRAHSTSIKLYPRTERLLFTVFWSVQRAPTSLSHSSLAEAKRAQYHIIICYHGRLIYSETQCFRFATSSYRPVVTTVNNNYYLCDIAGSGVNVRTA